MGCRGVICVLFIFFSVILGAEIRCKLCPVVQYDEKAVKYEMECKSLAGEKRITFQCRDGYSYHSGSYISECRLTIPWWKWTRAALVCITTKTTTTTTTRATTKTISSTGISTRSPSTTSKHTTRTVNSMTQTTTTTFQPTSTNTSIEYTTSTVQSSTNDFKTTSSNSCSEDILRTNLDALNVVLVQSSFKPDAIFKMHDRIRFECAKGYRFINGTLEHVCGKDGFWKGDLPYCKKCTCPCSRMKKQIIIKTKEELQNKIDVMTEQLKVKKTDLASVKSRKISASDPRPSSKAVGSVLGIGILVFIFAVIIISDLPLLYRHIRYGPYA